MVAIPTRAVLLSAGLAFAALCAQIAVAQNDWPVYGRDPGAQRYSPLVQINAGNVSKLVQAWVYDTKPNPNAKSKQASKTTPLVVNDVMYFTSQFQSLMAVEPETVPTTLAAR